MIACPVHDLLGELVIHGRLARFGDDEQGFVVFTEESVSGSPVEIEIGELRKPAATARLHFHQAERIGDEVICSQS